MENNRRSQLSLKNKLPIAVKGGTFIIDINYRLSGDWNAAECIVTSDEQYYDGKIFHRIHGYDV